MTNQSDLDLVVLGTGSAAQSVAYPCREAGWSVAIVDCRPFGGTCELRGCDPKKVLVGVADALATIRRLEGRGLVAPNLRVAWPDLQRFKRTFTDPAPPRNEASFVEAGIQPYHGVARFTGPTSVCIESIDAADNGELRARHVVIATGAEPAHLGIPGEELLTTSEQFLNLEELPRRLIFIGGGYISFEFASVAARAGAQVQIVHRGARPLEGFDPDLVGQMIASVRELGVDVRLARAVTGIERRGETLVVRTRSHPSGANRGREQEQDEEEIAADMVVHGAGRVPEIDDLALERAGVAFDWRRGVRVNAFLQSVSNPAVYAAGDAADASPLRLTPVAGLDGGVVAHNLLHGNTQTPNFVGTPTVVYTDPPLARVGLLEREAREQDLHFRVHREETSEWYSSRRVGLTHTGFKVLIDEGSERILGAHLLGPQADEVINLFGLAMRTGLPASALRDMRYAYPTSSSDVPYML